MRNSDDDGLGPDISIYCHYGGRFDSIGCDVFYDSEIVTKFDQFRRPDSLSFFELERAVKQLSYGGDVARIWWKRRNETITEDLKTLASDADIVDMCEASKVSTDVDIYVEHNVSYSELQSCLAKTAGISTHGDDDEQLEDDCVGGGSEHDGESFEDDEYDCGDSNAETDDGCFDDDDLVSIKVGEETVVGGGDFLDFDEEYRSDDYPDTPLSTDEEWERFNEDRVKRRTKKFGENVHICLMQEFDTRDDFKDRLLRYSLSTGYDIKYKKTSYEVVVAKCSFTGCLWKVYCSINKQTGLWIVKTFKDRHSCTKTGRTKMLKINEIAKLFEGRLRRKPTMKAAEIKDEIKREFNLTVSINMCTKAKRRALDKVRGDFTSQFRKLWDYELEIQRSNPGTTTEIQTKGLEGNREVIFHRFYICFNVLKSAWKKHCRPIIGLDGCFLKWDMRGELLAAVGRDGNNCIFPIAWAVVDLENTENWEWFIQKLKTDLDIPTGEGLTVITDKQKGLLKTMQQEWPKADHRMCARHIYQNWRKRFKDGMLKPLFWKIVKSFNKDEYDASLENLKECNQDAYASIIATGPESWCRAFFKTDSQCPDAHNNLSESFNNTIKEARRKPIFDMLEDIRKQAMVRIARRSQSCDRWKTKFTPKATRDLEQALKDAQQCRAFSSTQGEYEVQEVGMSYVVNLQNRSCACREWDLTGIPCRHAVCVISENKDNINTYVSDYYLTSKCQETYRFSLKAMNGPGLWEKANRPILIAPNMRRKVGRPKKHARIKAAHESPSRPNSMSRHGRVMTCHHCYEQGHNLVTCPRKNEPSRLNPKASTRGRGRPRKEVGDQAGPSKAPRKRGRPRKNPDFNPSSATGSTSQLTVDNSTGSQPFSSTAPQTANRTQSSQTSQLKRRQTNPRQPRTVGIQRCERVPQGYGLYVSPSNKPKDRTKTCHPHFRKCE